MAENVVSAPTEQQSPRTNWLSRLLLASVWPLVRQIIITVAVVAIWDSFMRDGEHLWQTVYERSDRSTVEVLTRLPSGGPISSLGTGFVYEVGGRLVVVTNRHVVTPSRLLTVRFRDNVETAGEILDASETNDLAIVLPSGVDLHRYSALHPGNSTDLRIGQELMTIGHPIRQSHHLSIGQYTGRSTDERGRTLLRLSMAVDPGNSGGPLVDTSGRVIGIITQKIQGATSIDS